MAVISAEADTNLQEEETGLARRFREFMTSAKAVETLQYLGKTNQWISLGEFTDEHGVEWFYGVGASGYICRKKIQSIDDGHGSQTPVAEPRTKALEPRKFAKLWHNCGYASPYPTFLRRLDAEMKRLKE